MDDIASSRLQAAERMPHAMNVFDFVFRPAGRPATSLASQVAQQIAAEVLTLAWPRARTMGLAEARGYLRAVATERASARIDGALLRGRGIQLSARANIVSLAAEGVVERLEADLARSLRGTPMRRAA
jgi:hypothetical protein